MYKRVSDFLNSNNTLANEEFGFRTYFAMTKPLFSFTDENLHAPNNKMHIYGTACDLAKAYECVNHEILLSKVNF
jgi:hypothetical protein